MSAFFPSGSAAVLYRLQFFDHAGQAAEPENLEAPTDAHAAQHAIALLEFRSGSAAVEVWREADLVFRYQR